MPFYGKKTIMSVQYFIERSKFMTRNHYFDNMKAFLIFLVVLGHMISGFFGDGSGGKGTVYLWIFSFHMPVFIFASGYFASTNTKKTLSKLIPLYLVFQMVQILIKFLYDCYVDPSTAVFEFQLFKPEWTLWYLMALILYSLVTPILDTDDRRKQVRNVILAIAAGLIIGFTPYTDNFLAISRMVTFLPFFLLGYYGKKNQGVLTVFAGTCKHGKTKLLPYRIIGVGGAVAMTALIIACVGAVNAKWFFGTLSYDDDFTFWSKVFTYMVSFIWLVVIVFLTPAKRIPLVDKIGQNTLGIYLFHTAAISVLKVVPPARAALQEYMVVVIIVSVVMTIFLGLDPFTNILKKIRIPYKENR